MAIARNRGAVLLQPGDPGKIRQEAGHFRQFHGPYVEMIEGGTLSAGWPINEAEFAALETGSRQWAWTTTRPGPVDKSCLDQDTGLRHKISRGEQLFQDHGVLSQEANPHPRPARPTSHPLQKTPQTQKSTSEIDLDGRLESWSLFVNGPLAWMKFPWIS